MRNYPELFEKNDFFSKSLFYVLKDFEEADSREDAVETVKLLEDCLKDYYTNSYSLSESDLELLDKIEHTLLTAWMPDFYFSNNHQYDQWIMDLCEVYIRLSDDTKHKLLYIKHAADFVRYFEDCIDPLSDIESQKQRQLSLMTRALELIDALMAEKNTRLKGKRSKIEQCIKKFDDFDRIVAQKLKEREKNINEFMKGREVHEGNDIIKRYIYGDAKGRTEWIVYFYTDCTDKVVIRQNCKKLFGGYDEEDAYGYVGAYTRLDCVSPVSIPYQAGFNYSFEQHEANYD